MEPDEDTMVMGAFVESFEALQNARSKYQISEDNYTDDGYPIDHQRTIDQYDQAAKNFEGILKMIIKDTVKEMMKRW